MVHNYAQLLYGLSAASDLPAIDMITATNTTTVLVTWRAPTQPDTIIIGYQVIYSVYESNDDSTSGVLDNNTLTYSIQSLGKRAMCIATYVLYNIIVQLNLMSTSVVYSYVFNKLNGNIHPVCMKIKVNFCT